MLPEGEHGTQVLCLPYPMRPLLTVLPPSRTLKPGSYSKLLLFSVKGPW